MSNDDTESVSELLLSVYNENVVTEIYQSWIGIVKEERAPILCEAIECYIAEKYYTCNALLLSQFGGIIKKSCPTRTLKFERNNRISQGHKSTVSYTFSFAI